MAIRVWVCNVAHAKNLGEKIITCLNENGIETELVNNPANTGTGILILTELVSELVTQLQNNYPVSSRYLLVLHNGTMTPEQARQLMRAGASDILALDGNAPCVDEMIARIHRWDAVENLVGAPYVKRCLIGESPAWKNVLRQLVEIAHFTDASVLIQGESGTGKELVARLIHELDDRKQKKELVILDCSTITPELSGSEFFGHERGAFTGAVSAREGAFALADQGTLFLDEIGELPLHLQTQLLRVIQEQTFKRVGGNSWQHTAFRLVCATNRDLWAQVQKGEFRADLYFRLASFICDLPPLRERTEDVLPLARHFLKTASPQGSGYGLQLDLAVEEYLLNRDYPGNIRDLRQVITRLLCRHAGKGLITLGCIPPDERETWFRRDSAWHQGNFELAIKRGLMNGAGLKEISRIAEDIAIRIAVDEAAGNLQQAAQRLGVTDRTLQLRPAARRDA